MVIALTGDVTAFWDLKAVIVASVSEFDFFPHKPITLNLNMFVSLSPFLIHPSVSCPNNCGGHGECHKNGICHCEKGYTGADCSTGNY